MKFDEAYKKMIKENKKIKLPSWNKYWFYSKEIKQILSVNMITKEIKKVTSDMIMSNYKDINNLWMCVEEDNKFYYYHEIYDLMKKEKLVTRKKYLPRYDYDNIKNHYPITFSLFYYNDRDGLCKMTFGLDEKSIFKSYLVQFHYTPEIEEISASDYIIVGRISDLFERDKMYQKLLEMQVKIGGYV